MNDEDLQTQLQQYMAREMRDDALSRYIQNAHNYHEKWYDEEIYKSKYSSGAVSGKIASSGSTAGAFTGKLASREKPQPKKIELIKSFDCPSGTVHSVLLNDDYVGAYLFSEYRSGEDWFLDQNRVLIVKDHVLTDLLIRFG